MTEVRATSTDILNQFSFSLIFNSVGMSQSFSKSCGSVFKLENGDDVSRAASRVPRPKRLIYTCHSNVI